MTHTALYDSPIGLIALTFDGEAITGLRFSKTDNNCVSKPPTTNYPLPTKTHHWLDLYFSGTSITKNDLLAVGAMVLAHRVKSKPFKKDRFSDSEVEECLQKMS